MKRYSIVILFAIMFVNTSKGSILTDSTSNSGVSVSFNADFVSRYIWRGLPLSSNPNIQPYGELDYKGFAFGAWASYGIAVPYAEVDLFLSYTTNSFTITLNDYFNEDEPDFEFNNYFDWHKDLTAHALEGVLSYEGPESFPVSLTAATFFYGNDRDIDGSNLFSTYLEVGYNSQIGEYPVKVFLGGTPKDGYYASKAAIVNAGVTISKELKLNENFSIPVNASFIVNPDKKNVFFVVGFTF